MEIIPTVDEDEALRNIQRQSEASSDTPSNDVKLTESEEAIIAEDGGVAGNNNRGDEGVLEGVAVGNIDVYSSDSDEDEDCGIIIHSGRALSAAPRRHTPHFDRSSKVYLRPQALTPTGAITYSDVENPSSAVPVKDETKRLRFSHHRTAFDVDIENLESHPWRTKNVDLSDYFNYGFTEATWQLYSERQLLLRSKQGLGPYHPAPVIASLPARVEPVPAVTATVVPPPVQPLVPVYAPAAVLPQALSSIPVQPAPVFEPPRPVPIMTAPPVMKAQPPPPRRAPPSVSAPEQFVAPAALIPPQYAPASAQVSPMYMQHQQAQNHQGVGNWPGAMPGMGMMGAQGMAWDPHGQLPALGGFGFPGQSNIMPQYGMHLGVMPGGMMHVDPNQRHNYLPEGDMGGFLANDRSRNEEFFDNRAGNDNRGFDANRRDRRHDSVGQERHGEDERRSRGTEKDFGSGRADPTPEDRDRTKSARNEDRDQGRDNNDRESRNRNGSDRIEDSNDDRSRTSKRKRNGEDDTSGARHDRDRDRDSSRNVRSDRSGDRERR